MKKGTCVCGSLYLCLLCVSAYKLFVRLSEHMFVHICMCVCVYVYKLYICLCIFLYISVHTHTCVFLSSIYLIYHLSITYLFRRLCSLLWNTVDQNVARNFVFFHRVHCESIISTNHIPVTLKHELELSLIHKRCWLFEDTLQNPFKNPSTKANDSGHSFV